MRIVQKMTRYRFIGPVSDFSQGSKWFQLYLILFLVNLLCELGQLMIIL